MVNGSDGSGGLLIIYGKNIINNGSIETNGTQGGTGEASGGGSGGGSINIFYSDRYTNNNSIIAQGGDSGISTYTGTNTQKKKTTIGAKGGDGCITASQIDWE